MASHLRVSGLAPSLLLGAFLLPSACGGESDSSPSGEADSEVSDGMDSMSGASEPEPGASDPGTDPGTSSEPEPEPTEGPTPDVPGVSVPVPVSPTDPGAAPEPGASPEPAPGTPEPQGTSTPPVPTTPVATLVPSDPPSPTPVAKDPCAGLVCGAVCDPSGGALLLVAGVPLPGYCDADGLCTTAVPDCGESAVQDCPAQCPVTNVCQLCDDGSCASAVPTCNPDGSCGPVEFTCPKDASAYDPCARKAEGDNCSLCAPDDSNCLETAEIKTCVDGTCTSGVSPVEF